MPTPGSQIAFASTTLLPKHDFKGYLAILNNVLSDEVHYVDPVHELRGKTSVLSMLEKMVPRVANPDFSFELLHDGETLAIWKWHITIRIRFTPFKFGIHGLVEAHIRNGKIYYQREYYDPMESIGVIPIVGFLYKLVLKLG